MLSIIIPAHNEEAVIGRSLAALLEQGGAGQAEIVVACNGCTDRTAEVARSFGPAVRVVETATASKVAALNLGDSVATAFPRCYMDADVSLSGREVLAMAEALREPGVLAVAPRFEMDFEGANWAVRAYYRVWTALPYTQGGMMGAGTYMLSEEGRRRFGAFPNVIADDGYVRLMFKPHERRVVQEACSRVKAPATLRDLVRIKTRSRLGEYELRRRFPELFTDDSKAYGKGLRNLLRRPGLWPAVPAYLLVNLASRYRAKRQLNSTQPYRWERDESSRAPAAAPTGPRVP